jgi:hypothetical protein
MSIVLQGSTSGSITLQEPAVAGTNTLTLPAATGTVAITTDFKEIGVGQTWQTVTRVLGTTYTNSTDKPIMIAVTITQVSGGNATFTVGGVQIYNFVPDNISESAVYSAIIPSGSTYVLGGTATITSVAELR